MNAAPGRQSKRLRLDTDESNRTSDDVLIDRAVAGSDFAFQQLVLREQQKVRVFLARYIFTPDQIEDVAQEVFIAAYRQLESFRRTSAFSTWLLAIARNKAVQFLRSEIRRRKLYKNAQQHMLMRDRLKALEQEDEFEIHEERVEALRGCLTQLPVESRHLIERFYYQNISSAKLAEKMNCKDGSIRMKLLRIRKQLGACIRFKLSDENN